ATLGDRLQRRVHPVLPFQPSPCSRLHLTIPYSTVAILKGMDNQVAVVGAGSSGLAAMKALREEGLGVEGFERGSDVGGLWRYENDNGRSAAYASLRTNVSRSRMQYPSF